MKNVQFGETLDLMSSKHPQLLDVINILNVKTLWKVNGFTTVTNVYGALETLELKGWKSVQI
jgi:hypothetical protein